MSKPYNEQIEGNIKYREFDPKVETDELVWHRDRENRTITVLEGKGWFFQMDNEIPKEMCAGDILEVKKMDYHRLYKSGTTPLKISIEEKYMRSFKQYISESKDGKNTHMTHIEDRVIYGGVKGAREAIFAFAICLPRLESTGTEETMVLGWNVL